MPLLSWLDIAALSISTVIATSLILIVLGADLTRVLKHSFALFTLMEVIWVISALFFCLSLWSGPGLPKLVGEDSLPLLELSTMPIGLASVFSLLFTVLFLDRRTRWTDLTIVLGLLLIVALTIPTFSHQPFFNPRIATNRITAQHSSLWRWMGAAIPVVYIVWSLVLLRQEQHRTRDFHLALVMLILLIGIVAGAVFDAPALFVSLSNALSAAILGYEIVSRQILNPLRERASNLQWEVAERKRVEEALWQRTAQLEALEAATATVNSTLDYDEVLKRILEQIVRVMPQAAANIMLVGGNSASVLRGYNYEQLGTTKLSSSLSLAVADVVGLQKMLKTGQPLVIPDVEHCEEWVCTRPEHAWIKSYAGVPIRIRDRVIGFLNVNSATPGFFDQADAERLGTADKAVDLMG